MCTDWPTSGITKFIKSLIADETAIIHERKQELAPALSGSSALSRLSEQWEMVMDSIPEVDEETLRSNHGGNSNLQEGEFGINVAKDMFSVDMFHVRSLTSLVWQRRASPCHLKVLLHPLA